MHIFGSRAFSTIVYMATHNRWFLRFLYDYNSFYDYWWGEIRGNVYILFCIDSRQYVARSSAFCCIVLAAKVEETLFE